MAATGLRRRTRLALKRFMYSGFRRDRWQHPDRVVEALGLRAGDRVADLGAGGGYFTFRLAQAVGETGRIYAVDTDPDSAAILTERSASEGWPQVLPVAAREQDPALPEPVDLVLTVNAFHHLPDPATYFRTVARYLRPGGRVAVVEARPRWFRFGHATEPAQIRSAMTTAGYTPAQEHAFLAEQSFQVYSAPPAEVRSGS